MELSRYVSGVAVNQIKINPDLGISIQKWDSISSQWKAVFYTNNNGVLIANELVANQATIQGLFKTGGVNSARLEIDNNGIKSYNSSNNLHGLYVSAGAFTDFYLYNNNSPQYLIYDDGSVIDMYAIITGYNPETDHIADYSNKRFLTTSGSITNPQNTWNCSDASFISLSDGSYPYTTTSDVYTKSQSNSRYGTDLSYDSSTKVLSLLNNSGSIISSVALT
jgi:hypothetical protein